MCVPLTVEWLIGQNAGMQMDDKELIADRHIRDERTFLSGILAPTRAPRLAPAANAARELLSDQHWHDFDELTAAMLRPSDIAVKTATGLIRRLVAAGFVEQRGQFTRGWRGGGTDTRQYRITEWPELKA